MYEEAAFVSGTGVRNISFVACGIYQNQLFCQKNSNTLLKKTHLNFIYSILWNVVTNRFAAIELVIVLAWFM